MNSTQQIYKSGSEWILDLSYDNWQDVEWQTDSLIEYSSETAAFNARQYHIWRDLKLSTHHGDLPEGYKPQWLDDFVKWAKVQFLSYQLGTTLKPCAAWFMDYDVGGWQILHLHQPGVVSAILYLDDPKVSKQEARTYAQGSLTLALGDSILNIVGFQGRCCIMGPRIAHSVNPVQHVPRRTLVVDFVYN